MASFLVNGKPVTAERNQKLLRFLRDELRIVSAKDGCSEGACGACMVLVDGRAVKACVQQTDKLQGKAVLTVEGFTAREQQVYGYAFAKAGAVQCGFCTPGMLISAKALLDANPSPTREQVKAAINNNICRCTGYQKIEDAILLAAKLFEDGTEIPVESADGKLGDSPLRVDAVHKALGRARYADDLCVEGMLYASAVRSEYPRARVLSIDTSAALKEPGIVAVLTADDIPGAKKIGHLVKDYDVLIPIGGLTHFLGDAIALVVAENPDALERAKSLVRVGYEPLPPILSPKDAMDAAAPRVHEERDNLLAHYRVCRRDADAAIENAAHVVTNRYSLPFTEHAFLEPECAVALPEGEGLRIYSGDQGIYQTRHECADMLGLPHEKVRVSAMMVGGGFGGKEDMSVQHHAALAAWLLKRPVKVRFTRQESILIHPKRHAMELCFTTACDENGILLGMKAELIADTGAYASLCGPVLQRACTHAAGPYNYQNVEIDGKAYYTNNPPAGAFRGFGVPQSCFATECNLNQLAERVGISPFEMR